MESAQRESRKNSVNPERKYMRLQEIGLSHILAWPVAIMLAAMFSLDYWIPHISVLLIMIGIAFLSAGDIGRRELVQQKEGQANDNNSKDEP